MRLAIISQSARIYSEIAHLEGYDVLAVDAYADADTQVAATASVQWAPLAGTVTLQDMPALFERLDRYQPDAVMIGSGFEAAPECYQALCERYPVYGNSPACVAQVKDPVWLKQCCDQLGLASPEVRISAPTQGEWMHKQRGQCGGTHVSRWDHQSLTSSDARSYWQAYQAGQPVGLLFVARTNTFQLIGVHALAQQSSGYAYAGAARLQDAALTQAAHALLKQLLPALGLVGINSIDAVWHAGRLHVLEVNPRLSASMRLYANLPLIQAHLNSCQSRGVLSQLQPVSGEARHCIAYATSEIDLTNLYLPLWVEDRPQGGSVAAGQPLCSLYAEGETEMQVQQDLLDKKTRLEQLWGTYVCNNIEFNIH